MEYEFNRLKTDYNKEISKLEAALRLSINENDKIKESVKVLEYKNFIEASMQESLR